MGKRGRTTNSNSNASISNHNNFLSHNSPEQDCAGIMGKSQEKGQGPQEEQLKVRMHPSLQKTIIMPPYISVTNGNRLVGSFGHATALFKRPVIEGHYFIQFLIKEDAKPTQNVSNASAIRVGICPQNFNPSFPLGYRDSIAYKPADGAIVRGGDRVGQAERAKVGDTIRLCLLMRPPCKYSEPEKPSEGSQLTFYWNGRVMGIVESLSQVFYCLGVSLFNYGQVQTLPGPSSRFKMPAGSSHYFSMLHKKLLYKNLDSLGRKKLKL